MIGFVRKIPTKDHHAPALHYLINFCLEASQHLNHHKDAVRKKIFRKSRSHSRLHLLLLLLLLFSSLLSAAITHFGESILRKSGLNWAEHVQFHGARSSQFTAEEARGGRAFLCQVSCYGLHRSLRQRMPLHILTGGGAMRQRDPSPTRVARRPHKLGALAPRP